MVQSYPARSVVSALLVLLSFVGAPLLADQAGDRPEADRQADNADNDDNAESVDTILEKQEAALRAQPFTYDPGGRRDPFQSLDQAVKEAEGPRPVGIAGMAVDQLDLTGIVENPGGDVAFVTGADGKGHFLHVGDKIYKGVLTEIDADAGLVKFRVQVNDPRSIKPYREAILRVLPDGG
jgi:Tfp pilus assembly protein PilP